MDDDAYDFEPQADAIVNGAEFNQDAPMTEYERAFEDFKMAAANAAAKGEKEFEYPAGSGKKHPTKMDKATAAKLLADSQTNEESLSEEQLNEFVQFLVPALVAGARVVGPRLLPAAKKGAQMIGKLVGGGAKVAARNPIKTTVGGVAAANPTATMDLAKGAVDTAKTVGALPGQAKELVSKIGQNVSAAGDKVIQTADDLKAMAAGTLDNLPTMDKIAGIAKQYALPAAVVMAILYGGYKVVDSIFGKDEKEANDDDADTIDLSPKGAGDEMKQKNEIPVEEFVKSMYDYTHNAFPKGETAVLTSVQKEYGDEAVDEAGQVIQELLAGRDREMARIQQLAGVR